ncbi:MAG: hypothetical protein FWC47_03270 [Oscillospiraceae bacterium]|nr:hypothetical protein [Oscillospiraceae bacterium]
MFKANKIQKIIIIVLAFYLLVIATYITINFSAKSVSNIDKGDLENSKIVVNEVGENSLVTTKDTLIVLNMKFDSNQDTVSKEIKAGTEYENMTKSEIEVKFKNLGFTTLDEFSDKKVVFSKESFYLPDKYIIGIKGVNICIYKTDEYGNLKVENQSDIFTNMDASKLPEKERQFLYKGHINYQFATKEEAIAALDDDYREFFKQDEKPAVAQ